MRFSAGEAKSKEKMNSDACRPIYRWKAETESFQAIYSSISGEFICSLDAVAEQGLFAKTKKHLIPTWREGERERGNRRAETAQLSSTSWPGCPCRYPEWYSVCAACEEKANNVHQIRESKHNLHLRAQAYHTKTHISPSSSLFAANESSASAFSSRQTRCRRQLAALLKS